MIAIPFVVMLAAVLLGSSMFRTFRILTGQPAAKPALHRHLRPRTGSIYVVTFGRNQFGAERVWRYHVIGGAR